MTEHSSEHAQRIRKALPELVKRLRRTGKGRKDLIWDPIRRISANEPLLHLLERLSELPDEDIVAVWRHMEGQSDEEIAELLQAIEPGIVAFRRETAMVRLRQETAPPAVPGAYYNPPDPEQVVIAAEMVDQVDQEAASRVLAGGVVADVTRRTLEQLPEGLAKRLRELASGYAELEAALKKREATLTDRTRQRPGSRRFVRDIRRFRVQLEQILMRRVYPRAADRTVARNIMRADMMRFFKVMVEAARTGAEEASAESRPYYLRLASHARKHLSRGYRQHYLRRLELLRALIGDVSQTGDSGTP